MSGYSCGKYLLKESSNLMISPSSSAFGYKAINISVSLSISSL